MSVIQPIQHTPVFPERQKVVRRDPNPIHETTPAYAWVLHAVAPLRTDTKRAGPTLVREDYHRCLLAILSSMYRQQQLYARIDTDEPTVKEEPVSDDDAVTLPYQLRVGTSINLSDAVKYPNPFESVRYRELSNCGNAVIITGLPGIGKTRFLCLLFYLRVAAKLPTLYMSKERSAIVYKDGGFSEFLNFTGLFLINNLPTNTWCLVDSNESPAGVPAAVVESGLFIIQAASPREDRTNYVKGLDGTFQFCLLRDWTLAELIVGELIVRSAFLYFTPEQKIKDFFEKYGGSARHVFKDIHNVNFETNIDTAAEKLDADKILQQIRSTCPSLAVPDQFGHMLLSVFPLEDDEDRSKFQVRSPSILMRQKLLKRISDSETEARGHVFRICKGMNTPGCKAWTADILKEDYHSYLLSGQTWSLFEMKKSPGQPDMRAQKPVATLRWKSQTTKCGSSLWTSAKMSIGTTSSQPPRQRTPYVAFEKDEEPKDLRPHVYYHPKRKHFATFDSFYVDNPGHVLAFQASVAQTHDVSKNGVEWLAARGVTKITYIYVWPTGIEGWPEIKVPVAQEKVFDSFYHLRLPVHEEENV